MRLFALTFLLLSCAADKKPRGSHAADVSALRVEFDSRKAAYELETNDRAGWASDSDCDGTLWAGIACSAGAAVDIGRAEYEPGRIERRPGKSCYPGDSRSSISNDMLTGYLLCAWTQGDVGRVGRLAAYGEAHELRVGPALVGWVMGDPYPDMASRVVMRPGFIGLVGRMRCKLSHGSDCPSYRSYLNAYFPVRNDYEKHLQVLSIALDGEVEGKIDQTSVDRLRTLASEEPMNPLFAAVLGMYDGNMQHAINLLMDRDTPVPTYVRGDRSDLYAQIHWLRAAKFVIDSAQ